MLGVPGIMLVLAGNGWMRGVQDTRSPVRIVLIANALSAAASPILVYPAGLGLAGSAIANVGAQAVGGLLFLRAIRRERARLAAPLGRAAGAARRWAGSFSCARPGSRPRS